MNQIYRSRALVFYVLVFLILTFPLAINFNRAFLGSFAGYGDLPLDIWLHWFVFSCIKAWKAFFFSTVTNYPVGSSLIDNVSGFLIPVVAFIPRSLFGQIAGYNLTVCFFMVFSAYAGYLLARYLIKDGPASILAGFIFGFNPLALNEVFYGRLITAATGWIALYALFLYKIIHEPRKMHVGMALVMLVCASLTSIYYGFFLVLFTAVFMGFHGVRYAPLRVDWSVAGRLSFVILGFILCMAFFYRSHARSLIQNILAPGSLTVFLQKELPPQIALIARQSLSIDLTADNTHIFPDVIKRLSIAITLLSVSAVIVLRKRVAFWIVSGAFFLILALGPILMASGRFITIGGSFIPMPYLLLYCFFPFFSRIHWPDRFLILCMLSAAILSAHALQWVIDATRAKRVAAYSLCAVAIACIIVEAAVIPLAPLFPAPVTNASVPRFYDELSREDGDFAVIQFPFGNTRYLYYQTVHHKKIFDGQSYLTKRHPAAYEAFIKGNAFLATLQRLQDSPAAAPINIARSDIAQLKTAGFRYLVIEPSGRVPTEQLVRSLQTLLDTCRVYSDGIIVFTL